ncbi:neuropeptide FF receptor 2-like [Branchiostoma floridae x Branchiostoma belcheri]
MAWNATSAAMLDAYVYNMTDNNNNNTTTAVGNCEDMVANPKYKQSLPIVVLLIVVYVLVILACLCGNGLVCIVVAKNRSMRTVTNYFIANLAVTDLLVGVFCMPITLIDNFQTGWEFGALMCKLLPTVQGIAYGASVFTLVAIAVDRYLAVTAPNDGKLTGMCTFCIILVIWLSAIIIMAPISFATKFDKNDKTCFEYWTFPDGHRLYTLALFVMCYLAPLVAITSLYIRIAVRLYNTSVRSSAHCGAWGTTGAASKLGYKVRVFKMLVVVVVIFTLLHLPLHTVTFLADYGDLSCPVKESIFKYGYPIAHWLAFVNSCVNPIVYGCMNRNFRKGFASAFRRAGLPCCSLRRMNNLRNTSDKRRRSTNRTTPNAENHEDPAKLKGSPDTGEIELVAVPNDVTRRHNSHRCTGTTEPTVGVVSWISQV